MQTAIALGVGVRFVPGVDDGATSRGGAGDAFPDVFRPLGDRIDRAARRVHDLACTHHDLPGHQERNEHVRELAELTGSTDEVVLVAAVRIASRVGVVLEEIDVAADALGVQTLLCVNKEAFEYAFAGLVVSHEFDDVVTLRRGVLRVATDVEVQPCTIAQEHVAASPPRDDLAEEIAGDLVGTEASLTAQRARHAVLILDSEDAPIHMPTLRANRKLMRRIARGLGGL